MTNNNVVDQIMNIVQNNLPIIIMTIGKDKKTNIFETLIPILVIPLLLILFKKIFEEFPKLFELMRNYKKKQDDKKYVIIKYYEKSYGKLIKDSDHNNKFYQNIMEYIADKYCDQLSELNTEQTQTEESKYIFGRRFYEEIPKKQIPSDKTFQITINDKIYEISHNCKTVKKIELGTKDENIKTIDYANNYFEIKAQSHEDIKHFELKINEYFALQKPLIENFHLYKTNLYYYDISNGSVTNKERNFCHTESEITTKKSWNNTFLTMNEEKVIKNEITEFVNSEEKYEHDGIPWKKGYIFHGEPGCGKSSLIYAIGWETKRNIYSIDLSSIKTNAEFTTLIKRIPKKSILLFDDIDAHEISHCRKILAEKKKNSRENIMYKKLINSYYNKSKYGPKNFGFSNSDNDSDNIESIHNKKDKKDKKLDDENPNKDEDKDKKNKKEKIISDNEYGFVVNKFTLDYLLAFLDGYSSLHGCIVIMTTNRLKVLDSALIRPGRIDHQIEFKNCDRYQFKTIYKFFTSRDLPLDYVFKENEYTTSYIINTIIIPNRNQPEKILNLLK